MNNENLFREGTKLYTVWMKGQEWFEKASNQDVMTLLGIDNAGYASNIRRDVAEKTGWTIFGATGERAPRSNSGTAKAGKIKGCLPLKIAVRISRQLDLDEDVEPDWSHWRQCYDQNEGWEAFTMSRFAGGEESEGGKAYRAWIDSNRAADSARAAAENTPAGKLARAEARIALLESLLINAGIDVPA